jgi:hypothetical protein
MPVYLPVGPGGIRSGISLDSLFPGCYDLL